MKWTLQRRLAPYLFICPFFIGYLIFFIYPAVNAIYLSLHQQTGVTNPPKFVGLENYIALFSDELFGKALFNTTYYAAGSIFIIVPIALGLALMLTVRKLRFRESFRLFFFLPYITSGVVVGIIFGLIFSTEYGVLNYALGLFGIPKVRWLQEPLAIIPAIILLGIWRFVGINALYFMSGLQAIPPEVIESAQMDGASSWQVFRHITLPLLRPTLIFIITIAIIGSYNLFAEPRTLVGPEGGARNSGLFMTMYLYLTGFRFAKFGAAAAIGITLSIIILILAYLQLRLMRVFSDD